MSVIHVAAYPAWHIVFDIAAWCSGLALGAVLYRWRLSDAAERLAQSARPGYFAALAIGAVAGAWLSGSLNTLRGPAPTLSHSVAGALVGAIVAVEIYKRARGITGSTGSSFVGPFAIGVVIGRWGCLFAGLPDRTYGAPTRLPWAVDLGDGIGRQPVEVYESLSMALFLAIYLVGLKQRAPWAIRRGFYALCLAYAFQRFAWEFLKPYPTVLGPFNLFHILCGGLAAYAVIWWRSDLGRERRAQKRALSVPGPDHQPV